MQICLNRDMEFKERFGQLILDIAEKKGFSQVKLGEYVGMSQAQIGRIFKGENKTNIESLRKLCIALQVSPEDLLFPDAEKTESFLYRTLTKNQENTTGRKKTHELLKALSELNYDIVVDGGKLDTDELMAVEALLRTCLKSLHKERKNETTTESAKTA